MRQFSTDEIETIALLAKAFMKPEEMAMVLEIEFNEFKTYLQDTSHQVYKTIKAEQLKTKAKVRASIFSLAENGSGPAQTEAKRMIELFEHEQRTKA